MSKAWENIIGVEKLATGKMLMISPRTKHISIRYFFVKDRVDKGEMSIEYFPTGIMLADYFTTPLQGSLFNKFRDVIMSYSSHISTLQHDDVKIKEREGISNELQMIYNNNHEMKRDRNEAKCDGGKQSPPSFNISKITDDNESSLTVNLSLESTKKNNDQ